MSAIACFHQPSWNLAETGRKLPANRMRRTMNSAGNSLTLVGLALLALLTTQAQPPTREHTRKGSISSVILSGKLDADVYSNGYLGIRLKASKAQWNWPDPDKVNLIRNRARLVGAVYDSGVPERGPQQNYTLGLLVESQESYPQRTTVDQYVRGLRQRVEDENVKIYREASPLTVQGVPFVGTVFRFYERSNSGYYRGLYSTILNGYFVTIEVQCGEEERLVKRLSRSRSLQNQNGEWGYTE